MLRGLPVLVLAFGLVGIACGGSSGNHTKPATSTPATSAQPPSPGPATSSPAPSPVRASTPGAVATTAVRAVTPSAEVQRAETELTNQLLQQSDVPQEVQCQPARPINNHDYAAANSDPAAGEKALNDAGRISGAAVRCTLASVPAGGTAALTGVQSILSRWASDQAATEALPAAIQSVGAVAAQPNTATVDSGSLDIGTFADQTLVLHTHIKSLVATQPDADIYVVGVRRGSTTALLVITGISGGPSLDQVKQLVGAQARKLK